VTKAFFCLLVFLAGIYAGIAIKKHKLFSKKKLRRQYLQFTGGYGPWSIGILKGPSPFELRNPDDIKNPVLTGENVTDMEALFVADPFLLVQKGHYFMFFEVMNRKTYKAAIGYATSMDAAHWKYGGIAVKETFHLSFPHVFQHEGSVYMVPESSDDWSVRLYKAVRFPDQWKYMGNLVSGYQYKDPVVFYYHDRWWMFVSTGKNDVLNLYFSEELMGEWRSHPMNPVVKFDRKRARSAGRIIKYHGKLFRMAQDASIRYGRQVLAYEIVKLSEKEFSEVVAGVGPVVTAGKEEWNRAGMHTVDLHETDGGWIAAVDGRKF